MVPGVSWKTPLAGLDPGGSRWGWGEFPVGLSIIESRKSWGIREGSCQRTIEMYSDEFNREKRNPNEASHSIKELQITTRHSPTCKFSWYTQNRSCFHVCYLKRIGTMYNSIELRLWTGSAQCSHGAPRPVTASTTLSRLGAGIKC